MSNFGLIRVAAATPKLRPANTEYNETEILECLKTADKSGCGVVLFPELCLTGATCGDLIQQDLLYRKSLESLERIVRATERSAAAVILGHVLERGSLRFNCAAFIQNGQIRGIVPKQFIPPAQARWFSPGGAVFEIGPTVRLFGADIPFGSLLFQDELSGLALGVEVGEDRHAVISPGTLLAARGARLLFNPAAEHAAAGQAELRRARLSGDSARLVCGYAIANAGVHESTTDLVFSGHNLIAENGTILAESDGFTRDAALVYAEIDCEALHAERTRRNGFGNAAAPVFIQPLKLFDAKKETLGRVYPKNPFLPDSPGQRADRRAEVFQIQCAGLAKRLEHTNAAKTVVGVSGGLDSTLALLVCAETHRLVGKPPEDIIALTLPGFGTTERTLHNARSLLKLLKTDAREISIRDSVSLHFKDIGHDPDVRDVTFENAQARERTQILMDIANQTGGLMVGTGDLSEAALGWSTFNGDHMSMYNVNAGVPKTFIRHMIQWIIDTRLNDADALRQTLLNISRTPISPELLPPDARGESPQKTEESVGPYALNDFFLYHTVRYGLRPEKLLFLANNAFAGEFSEDSVKKWLTVFYKRFFSQQFKRNCSPDGPAAFDFGFSPRGAWAMPSDADWHLWAREARAF